MNHFKGNAFDNYLSMDPEDKESMRESLAVYDRDPKLARRRTTTNGILFYGPLGLSAGMGAGMLKSSKDNASLKDGIKNIAIGSAIGGALGVGGGILSGRYGAKVLDRYHKDPDMRNLLIKQGYIREKEFSERTKYIGKALLLS